MQSGKDGFLYQVLREGWMLVARFKVFSKICKSMKISYPYLAQISSNQFQTEKDPPWNSILDGISFIDQIDQMPREWAMAILLF